MRAERPEPKRRRTRTTALSPALRFLYQNELNEILRRLPTPSQQEMGDALRQHRWDWFATVTFAFPIHPYAADQRFHRWMSYIRGRAQNDSPSFYWVRTTELHRRGVVHFHVLVSGVATLRHAWAVALWYRIGGRVDIAPYDANRGAAFYIVKGPDPQFEFSDPFPPFSLSSR